MSKYRHVKGFARSATYMDNIYQLFLIFMLNKMQFRASLKALFLCSFLCKAEVPDFPIPARLETPKFTPPNHLDPTIYPTEVGVSSVGRRGAGGQMLSTAIKITLDLQRNVKVPVLLKCTVSVNVFFFFLHLDSFPLFPLRNSWLRYGSKVLL